MPPDLPTVRDDLPCLSDEAYLNSGGSGPLPARVAAAVGMALAGELARGRLGVPAIAGLQERQEALRSAVAALLGATPAEIALTANTTAGLDAVIWGLDWRDGDEAITTALEHPGLAAPLWVLARRRGVTLRTIPSEEAHGDLERAVGARMGPRTRLVALSHVAWTTGAVLDVAGAARAARSGEALCLVDGAQSVGAIPVRPAALGVDAYAFPAHKWLLGPEGLGGLWVAPGALERIGLTFAGYESGEDHRPGGDFRPHPDARRYETSTLPSPLVPAWTAALSWLEGLGWDWIHAHTHAAQQALRAALAGAPGVSVLTPEGPQAGLVTFTVAGREPEAACRALAARGVMVRWLDVPAALRASAGFFTDETDVARLVAEIAALEG